MEFVLPGDKVLPRDDISLDSGFSDYEIEDVPEGIEFPFVSCTCVAAIQTSVNVATVECVV